MLTRRSLLQSLLTLPGLALPVPSLAQPLLTRLPLQGLERHQGRALWPVFAVGDPLRLAMPRDESAAPAIAVYWGEFLIGHLPRRECEPLRACVRRGELGATIAALGKPARELVVGVWRSR